MCPLPFPSVPFTFKAELQQAHTPTLKEILENTTVIMAGTQSNSEVMHIEDRDIKHVSKETVAKLIQLSHEAKEQTYCPYSKFRVGAAVLTLDNSVHTGKSHVKLVV